MKIIYTKSKMLLYFITAIALLSLSSCSKKLSFSSSSIVPAAAGSIKIKNDDNKNKTIEVNVSNLAPASQLTPPKKYMFFGWSLKIMKQET